MSDLVACFPFLFILACSINNIRSFRNPVNYAIMFYAICSLRGGGGGGGGVHPDFFVKLDFEIAVDQQTRAHDQTFEGVPDSGFPPVPAGEPRPY